LRGEKKPSRLERLQIRSAGLPEHVLHRRENGLWLENHPGPTTVGPIVYAPVTAGGEVADVRELDLDQASLDRPAENALPQYTREHVGENREDVDGESHGSGFRSALRLPPVVFAGGSQLSFDVK